MFPQTSQRVPEQTSDAANLSIDREMRRRVAYYATRPDEIDQRLGELDEEWDIERTLEANAASIVLGGVMLSLMRGRQWMILPGVVAGFLLQHALQGWCPPVEVFRRMGIRTMREIDQERFALKAMRGDFENLPDREDVAPQVDRLMTAVRQ